jgi:hypothetical protein
MVPMLVSSTQAVVKSGCQVFCLVETIGRVPVNSVSVTKSSSRVYKQTESSVTKSSSRVYKQTEEDIIFSIVKKN